MSESARESVRQEVLQSLGPVLNLDPGQVDEDMTLVEMGLDSMGLVQLVFAIEDEFDIKLPFNANEQDDGGASLMTIGQLMAQVVDLVLDRRQGAAEPDALPLGAASA